MTISYSARHYTSLHDYSAMFDNVTTYGLQYDISWLDPSNITMIFLNPL